ncbi:farnesyl diphosphate synthase [Alteromonas sp. KUL49]|uniref:farnesyl diphosphate synthase n=1 Tax=Alteromonas sp. KUL49 TaxID=2480798 RepID=UPI00102F0472|nr:farnesyl diphosphate synthase [Alteromonas sp. KUL49]TAP39887.1 geranyl transferase [Alteromonas sp. KUL49]GEA11907.1 (2E,6E)-farnesyl diphosphate synthase [Alteromonas sp. KUL49]
MNFSALHEQIKKRTDEGLAAQVSALPDDAPRLKAAMNHALLVGGKRMRPLLSQLVGNMLDVPSQDQLAISMAIECIHAYSLTHDDLPAMDDDELRRGHPTCHIAFDEATAILAGDALQTLGFSILADAPLSDYADSQRGQLLSVLARCAGYRGMCGGQAIDLASTGQDISLETLKKLHNLKTGALLRACVEMIIVASPEISENAATDLLIFADEIGLAFQVQDDILDIEGSSEQLGKPSGSDIALGKNTFPALLGLQGAKEELNKLHDNALQALARLPYNTDTLVLFSDLMVKRDH